MPSSSRCIPGESVSYAAYMFANIVSPPYGGTSRASSIVAIGGRSRYAVSLCQIPPKFTVSCGSFVTAMISGWLSMPFTNGYSHRLADAAREGEELVGPEDLVAEEDDEVVQPRVSDLGNDRVVEIGREVDAGDLGADRAGDAARP